MNPHEIYETLLRRGMPEHPSLHWEDDYKDGFYAGESSHPLSDSDARDLLTMHALRWLKTLPGTRGGCQRWQEGWNVFLDEDYWMGKPNDPKIHKFTADELLEAILAATAHLEPK